MLLELIGKHFFYEELSWLVFLPLLLGDNTNHVGLFLRLRHERRAALLSWLRELVYVEGLWWRGGA